MGVFVLVSQNSSGEHVCFTFRGSVFGTPLAYVVSSLGSGVFFKNKHRRIFKETVSLYHGRNLYTPLASSALH